MGVGLIDELNQCGESPLKRTVQSRPEEAVDNDVVLFQDGQFEVAFPYLDKLHALGHQEAGLVALAILGKMAGRVDQEGLDPLKPLFLEQAGDG